MIRRFSREERLTLCFLARFGIIAYFFALWTPSVCNGYPGQTPHTEPLQVRVIQFEGVHAFPVSELKKVLSTKERRFGWFTKAPLDEKVLDEDLGRIQKYYQSQGFYHARVVSHKVVPLVGNECRIEIKIEESSPMIVSGMNLLVDGESTGQWHEDLKKLVPLRLGERFTTPAYQELENVVLGYFGDLGYPKATLDLKATLNKKTNYAFISVSVERGPVCYAGSIYVEGNESVADEVILRELTFKSGDRFSASKIKDSQQRLLNLDLFQFVDLTIADTEGEETILPVRVLVKEAKKQTIRAGVGYGTEDDFRGQVQWEIRDFLGDGRRLQFNAKGSSLVQFLETKFVQPYPFGPRSTFILTGGAHHEDQESFENRKFFMNPLLNWQWTPRFNSYAGYDLEANRLLSVDVQADLGPGNEENQEYFISSLVGGNTWERVDDPLNPRRGCRFSQNVEWATSGLGSEVDFIKLTLEGKGYLPLYKYGVLAARLKYGGIQELENTQNTPIFKRFFAGGSESMRGYPYQRLGPLDADGDPKGGMTLVEGSVEWRFPIRNPFEGVMFFDFGNVYERSYELVWNDLRYSAGCGIRYLTLVGPLRLDFGYQLNPPEQDFFSPYQVHFSIGQAF